MVLYSCICTYNVEHHAVVQCIQELSNLYEAREMALVIQIVQHGKFLLSVGNKCTGFAGKFQLNSRFFCFVQVVRTCNIYNNAPQCNASLEHPVAFKFSRNPGFPILP